MNDRFLAPNSTLDADHPRVQAFAARHGQAADPVERAVQLYLAVRDGFRYDPWNVHLDPAQWKASLVLERAGTEGAHCIDKAMVLAAAARAVGIPSRLHFANVRNHIGTARLEAKLGTDLLVFHGYTGLYLEGRWVAATPAFNIELCERLGVEPLDFDGRNDSVFQAYDRIAGRFMEYVQDHGAYDTVPFDAMFAAWREHYGIHADGRWPAPR
jgi:transglutaminase-like putative cysteine protease